MHEKYQKVPKSNEKPNNLLHTYSVILQKLLEYLCEKITGVYCTASKCIKNIQKVPKSYEKPKKCHQI